MVQIRPRPELTNNSKDEDSSGSWKKSYSFFQGIETSIHFLGMKQKSISQAISNDKCVKRKNKHFRIGKLETNRSCGLGDKNTVYIAAMVRIRPETALEI